MRLAFRELPGDPGAYLRPVVPVRIEELPVSVSCLIDSGSLHNRFATWIADALGLQPSEDRQRLAIGGFRTEGWEARVSLSVHDMHWDAPVWFCDPWPLGFQVLGQEGFFRWFRVDFRAAEYGVDVALESH